MPRSRPFVERGAGRLRDERGSASLEFLTVGLILLVPLVYLVLAMSQIQAGALAVEGAARQAARVYALSESPDAGAAAAERAIGVSLADYGLERGEAETSLDCIGGDCLAPGTAVRVQVRASIALPLVPALFDLDELARVPVSGTATQPVSRFGSAP